MLTSQCYPAPGSTSRRPVTPWSARLAWAGIVGIAMATLAILLLHVLPGGRSLDPLSSTISEYALVSDGWLFDAGVVLLALSSAAVLGALVAANMVVRRSWGAAMTFCWCLGLIGLVVFPKHRFGVETTLAGRVHWTWTLIAFFSLPIGAALISWEHRLVAEHRGWPRWAVRLSMVAACWFGVLTIQTILAATTVVESWRVVGLVERALSATEMITVVVLAFWVLHAARIERPVVDPPG